MEAKSFNKSVETGVRDTCLNYDYDMIRYDLCVTFQGFTKILQYLGTFTATAFNTPSIGCAKSAKTFKKRRRIQ